MSCKVIYYDFNNPCDSENIETLPDEVMKALCMEFVDDLLSEELADDQGLPKSKKAKYKPRINASAVNWGQYVFGDDIKDPESKIAAIFRQRFRVPYQLFSEYIVPKCRECNIFGSQREVPFH